MPDALAAAGGTWQQPSDLGAVTSTVFQRRKRALEELSDLPKASRQRVTRLGFEALAGTTLQF